MGEVNYRVFRFLFTSFLSPLQSHGGEEIKRRATEPDITH